MKITNSLKLFLFYRKQENYRRKYPAIATLMGQGISLSQENLGGVRHCLSFPTLKLTEEFETLGELDLFLSSPGKIEEIAAKYRFLKQQIADIEKNIPNETGPND